MSPLAVSAIVFAGTCGGALAGLLLRSVLPDRHLAADSKDVISLSTGLIGTLTALVLGLLIGSAKTSFDTQRTGVAQLAANAIMLDRALALYGQETQPTRELLRESVTDVLHKVWPEERVATPQTPTGDGSETHYQELFQRIVGLDAKSDTQKTLQSQALKEYVDSGQLRWQLFAQRADGSIPTPLLAVMVAWLILLLGSFALFAPRNATALFALAVCALSVSSAIFLMLELDRSFGGLIRVSGEPLRVALEQLGR